MRGFLRVWARSFKILGLRERTKEENTCKMLLISPLFPAMFSYVAHAGPLFPASFQYVRNVGLRYCGEVIVDVSRCITHMLKYTSLIIPKYIDGIQ